MQNREKIVREIAQILENKKAYDIEIFNLSGTDYFVDFVIIATALIDRHALALLDDLKKALKEKGEKFYQIEDENPDWIVADLGDIVVHLFTKNQREKFNLEEFLQKMQEGKNV